MNDHQLRRLIGRLVLLSAPVPLAVLGSACGGATFDGANPEVGGSPGASGAGGSRTMHPGDAGSGGVSVGTGGVTGTGGASVGTGGSTGGTIYVGDAGSGGVTVGTGGSYAGSPGTAGYAGAGGAPMGCKPITPPPFCSPGLATVPRACVTTDEAVTGHTLPKEKCQEFCSFSYLPCTVSSVQTDVVSVLCEPGCAVGRRPAGLGESSLCDSRSVGRYFAEVAHLEAASVTAFRVLQRELRASGAPKKLVRAAARAARDEVRHARSTGALARRFGAAARKPAIEPRPLRSVEAMAIENAVEGCVRETFGALLATRQATHASDPVVRATMMRIARDETKHACLSWRVARFLDTRLGPEARRNVERAKRAAARELLLSLAGEPALGFADLAGLPSPAEALQLATEMNRALWS